ncbi:uncharacterized protein LAJ45_10971 [Morchella importuna]|uniref:uncharacterized protein n=1 Tax=Morchella importuna TaxID=1174673 RepID=UPI001E8CE9A0|nr:uncharacterized protein LAJ45_10971 [Morchella importuna]KAH8145060.1 hypothetical protein LAJ45_10971 [Morchella importuna]
MSSNPAPLLAGHPLPEYLQAKAAFAGPLLHQADRLKLFNKMGLEEKSPATDDLLQLITSTFSAQDPSMDPAKAIVSLLLGLSTQVEKLTTEATRSPTPPTPRPAMPIPPPQATPIEGTELHLNDPIETIDQNGNRRLLTYAEKLKQHHDNSHPTVPPPSTRNAGPRRPTTPQTATNLPTAQRRFFATRSNPAPFPNHQQLEARLPSDLGRVLANAGLTHPHTALQVQVNRNGTVTCTASPSTPAKDIAPYFPGLFAVLNLACNASENPLNEFQLAPTNVDYAIHNVPIFALDVPETLFTPHLAEAIALTTGASIAKARYLTKPENRIGKTTTTIVVSIPAEDTDKIGDQIRLFGRSRRCNKLWPASPNTLCRKCARLGHATEGCQSSSPTCPLCAGNHLRKDHRCPNQACPNEGHLKPVIECCATWKAKCINCAGNHIASLRECPARRSRTQPAATAPAPQGATPAPQNTTGNPPPVTLPQPTTPQSTSVPAPQQEGSAEEDLTMTQ